MDDKRGNQLKTENCSSYRNNIYWKLGLNNAPQLYREAIRRYGNPDDPIR